MDVFHFRTGLAAGEVGQPPANWRNFASGLEKGESGRSQPFFQAGRNA